MTLMTSMMPLQIFRLDTLEHNTFGLVRTENLNRGDYIPPARQRERAQNVKIVPQFATKQAQFIEFISDSKFNREWGLVLGKP